MKKRLRYTAFPLLFIFLFLQYKVQSSIEIFYCAMKVDTGKLHCFAGNIMPIMPHFDVLLVTLPDFDVLGKLADQNNFLDGRTVLISAKFHSTIFCFSSRR